MCLRQEKVSILTPWQKVGILVIEEFSEEIGKTEEFSLYIYPWRRNFLLILDPNHINQCFYHIFDVEFIKLIKNLCFPVEIAVGYIGCF